MNESLNIVADQREKPSGIPNLLMQKEGIKCLTDYLKFGDYIINNEIHVERKTADDFVRSIINGRLFNQCSKLRHVTLNPCIIVEGSPYETNHEIAYQAIQGAILSISISWHIPALFSKDKADTVEILLLIAKQSVRNKAPVVRRGHKPKKLKNRQLFFLQGLPSVGPSLALRLLQTFGNLSAILQATDHQLKSVEGIGKNKASAIRKFLKTNY